MGRLQRRVSGGGGSARKNGTSLATCFGIHDPFGEWPSGTGRDEVQRYVRFMQIYPVGSAVSTTKCVPLSWVSRPNSHGRAHGPDKPNRSSIPSSTTLARWGNGYVV